MYYDDEFFDRKAKNKGFSGFTVILLAILAALISGGVVAMLVPTMIDAGIIEISGNQKYNQSIEQQGTNKQTQDINSGAAINDTQPLHIEVNSGIVDAVEKIKPAVVGIVNIQRGLGGFFSNHQEYEAGSGSGVIFKVTGNRALVVTNHHVIEGADQITVTMMDGEQVPAKIVGSDELTDLAVLEMDASHVTTVAEFGNSDILRPGEPAIAIGNPLGLEFAQTVTVGVISATQRALPVKIGGNKVYEVNVIQTDAAINFGNSGGALVNINGQLIGINSAKIASSGVEGIGFAIPIRDAEPIINDLINHGRVQRPYLGITPRDLNTVLEQYRPNPNIKEGVILAENPAGPAAAAGLKAYDIIVEMDGKQVDNSVTLRKILYGKKIGDSIKVVFYRGLDRHETEIILSALPTMP